MKTVSFKQLPVVDILPAASGLEGVIVELSTDKKPYYSNGSSWIDMSAAATAGAQQVFVQPGAPSVAPGVPYLWFQTGLGTGGNDMTLWVEDGL
jgi:hypothetical protein